MKKHLGSLGQASKSITFKEEDFKKELAPKCAKIERFIFNGESFVKMTYDL